MTIVWVSTQILRLHVMFATCKEDNGALICVEDAQKEANPRRSLTVSALYNLVRNAPGAKRK